MNKKILAAFLCVCMVVVTGSFPVSAAKTKKTYKIAIDAGHQGKGNSKTEPIGPGAKMRKPKVAYGTQGVKTKVPESKLTLQIALKLEKELKKRGYDVYMIRRKQNVNIAISKERSVQIKVVLISVSDCMRMQHQRMFVVFLCYTHHSRILM